MAGRMWVESPQMWSEVGVPQAVPLHTSVVQGLLSSHTVHLLPPLPHFPPLVPE